MRVRYDRDAERHGEPERDGDAAQPGNGGGMQLPATRPVEDVDPHGGPCDEGGQ